MGSIFHAYLCILLCMKPIWCTGFPEIYARLEEWGGVNLPWVYVNSAPYDTCFVFCFPRDLCSIAEEGWCQSVMGIMCILLYI